MSVTSTKAAVLLVYAAFAVACDRSPCAPPPVASPAATAKAAEAACRLPLDRFNPSLRNLTGSRLDDPYSRVMIDAQGRIRWNSQLVTPARLREFIGIEAASGERTFLLIYPEKSAPCAVVRDVLAAALAAGRCSPDRCAFEWPPGNPPPPPPPEASS